jgi:hypothetical protein
MSWVTSSPFLTSEILGYCNPLYYILEGSNGFNKRISLLQNLLSFSQVSKAPRRRVSFSTRQDLGMCSEHTKKQVLRRFVFELVPILSWREEEKEIIAISTLSQGSIQIQITETSVRNYCLATHNCNNIGDVSFVCLDTAHRSSD